MRLLLDLQGAQAPGTRHRGIGRYSLAFAEAVVRNGGPHEVHLALNAAFPSAVMSIKARFAGLLPNDRIHVFDVMRPISDEPDDVRRAASEACREAFLTRLNPDVVHISSVVEGTRGDAVASIGRLGRGAPTAAMLYDLIPLIYPSEYLSDPAVALWYQERLEQLRRADLLMTISEASAREAREQLGIDEARLMNVGAAADPMFRSSVASEEELDLLRSQQGITGPFVMSIGGMDSRKNVETLIRAFGRLSANLRRGHQLVIVGDHTPGEKQRLLEIALEARLSANRIILTGFVSDEVLTQLYSTAKLFVCPSLHEGFGLPVLEAMQCGAAVIGSNSSSIPEVIGLEEALFDPHDSVAVASAMRAALTDGARLSRLKDHSSERARLFSWDFVGRRAVAAFESLYERHGSVNRPKKRITKPKLAYVSPLPPTPSGIATYSNELLPLLAESYEIDAIVDHDGVSGAAEAIAPSGLRNAIDWREFQRRSDQYDRVLYQFGNSEFHGYMLRLLESVPGVVVLHEFNLSGLVRHEGYSTSGGDPKIGERNWLAALYRDHGAAALLDYLKANTPEQVVPRYPCCISIADRSYGLILHSEYARSKARKWLTPERVGRAVKVPLSCSVPTKLDREAARNRLGIAPDAVVICTFGLMGPTKHSLELIRAWMKSAAFRDAESTLCFVGPSATGEYGRSVEQEILNCDHSERVRITGWVDDAVYRDHLLSCDVAVQLRNGSGGESSRTVLECMAYGIATIVNAHGATAELPQEAAYFLPDQFSGLQLTEAIDALWSNPDALAALGGKARDYVELRHDPGEAAEALNQAIEQFYERVADLPSALRLLVSGLDDDERARLATVAADATKVRTARSISVDITEIESRVSGPTRKHCRAFLHKLLEASPRHWRVELIRYDDHLEAYVDAHRYLADLIGIQGPYLPDKPVELYANDILLVLDAPPGSISTRRDLFARLQIVGLKTFFLVDDLRGGDERGAAEEISGRFESWMALARRATGVICSSVSLQDELRACIEASEPDKPTNIHVIRHWLSASDRTLDEVAAEVLAYIGVG